MSSISAIGASSKTLPLYDLLVQRLNQQNQQQPIIIDTNYLIRLTEVLTSLEPNQAEQVALLIIHYYYSTTNQPLDLTNLPYGIKLSSSGKGFSFDPNLLPVSFLALLGTYCCI